jgi:exosortase F-associated protein
MKKSNRFFFIIIVLVLLFCVRLFEAALFYDPFQLYFKADYTQLPFPNVEMLKWILNTSFRYFINAALTVTLLQIVFKKAEISRLTAFLLVSIFIVLLPLIVVVIMKWPEQKMLFFYLRRLLIQPIFLLVFLPAFYFQIKISKRKE